MDDHGEVSYGHAIRTFEGFGIKDDDAVREFLQHFTVDDDGEDDEWTKEDITGLRAAVKDTPVCATIVRCTLPIPCANYEGKLNEYS